eukprot:2013040-Pleurochrysis_carterae.AAC.1
MRRSLGSPKRSTRIEPVDIYLWRRKPRRQPNHKETRARLAARASELRTRPRVGVRGVCQGGGHPHCRYSHVRSETGDSRRVGRFDARA